MKCGGYICNKCKDYTFNENKICDKCELMKKKNDKK